MQIQYKYKMIIGIIGNLYLNANTIQIQNDNRDNREPILKCKYNTNTK